MPFIGFPTNLIHGLSDFWQRFFADAQQLRSLYDGTTILMGQAYLDLVSNVLNVSLNDVPVFNKEHFKLLTVREDQVLYVKGATTADDRWALALPGDLVAFQTLDNKVIEPTTSMQDRIDFTIADGLIYFTIDPTQYPYYAQRTTQMTGGGIFTDPTVADWTLTGVTKGDVLRLLEIGPGGQRQLSDHVIVLVRSDMLVVSTLSPLPVKDPQAYVVVRAPADNAVSYETLTFATEHAHTTHSRLVPGSVRIYAKSGLDGTGGDVVENIDYTVDYEAGVVYRLTVWQPNAYLADYQWLEEVKATSATGVSIEMGTTTVPVTQIAMWALDVLVDRRVMANNFGALINLDRDSSENYRALLRGIFQLYILGPVLERIESAINIVLGLPVVRDDGEVLAGVDTASSTLVNYVFTMRTGATQRSAYSFTKDAPLRLDVLDPANIGTLTFEAFEPLTIAVRVTDYIQDPDWWQNINLPTQLFTEDNGYEPGIVRRRVHPSYILNVVNPVDGARVGDPGLMVGADEGGFIPPTGHPIYRHRLAFVLMDRYLKFHMFFVKFDPRVFTSPLGTLYERTIQDLNTLVFSAKPSHTFIYVQPATELVDTFIGADEGVYQPQRFVGGDEDHELFASVDDLDPDHLGEPYALLGVFIDVSMGDLPPTGPATDPRTRERVLFADTDLRVLASPLWHVGDYFRYELIVASQLFPLGTPTALPGAPSSPRWRKSVHVFLDGETLAGEALVENRDYTYDRTAETITRLTPWASDTVTVKLTQLNVTNVANGFYTASGINPQDGDTALCNAGIDPANYQADYTGAYDWFGNLVPVTNARDLSLVERAVEITIIDGRLPESRGPLSMAEPFRLLGM